MTSFNKLKVPVTGGNKKQEEALVNFSNKNIPRLIEWEIENGLSVTVINLGPYESRLLVEPLSGDVKKQKIEFLDSLRK